MTVLARLVPEATLLRLEAWAVDDPTTPRTLRVRSTPATAPWPLGTTPAHPLHSHSDRPRADLPWAQSRVRLQLRVRKWFCRHRHCRRPICTERLPPIAAPGARRTLRLAQRLVALGVALGGTAGGPLGPAWDLGVRRHTLLRLLRRQPAPSCPTPTVLGVADCALRKRQTEGPLLSDLERRHPGARLPERPAAPVAPWLWEHPGGKVIARARATAYAEGARQGAPAAIQVADRLHLLQNLREALDQGCRTPSQALEAGNAAWRQQPVSLPAGAMAMPGPPHDLPRSAPPGAVPRQAHRQALHAQVWAVPRQGWTAPTMAPQGGLRLRTGQRELQSAPCAGRRRRSDYGDRRLNPSKPSRLERWNAGCSTAMRRLRALRQRG